MSVPHGTILWYPTNSAHADHLHVEPPLVKTGTPPATNPGMTAGVRVIYDALEGEFGKGAYFLDGQGRYIMDVDDTVKWTHMGGWNRRTIAGGSTWSQHAWWNALDIGPYVGVGEQLRFYNFLKGIESEDDDMRDERFNDEIGDILFDLAYAILHKDSHGSALGLLVEDFRKDIITRNELTAALATVAVGTVDPVARAQAASALKKLAAVKVVL